MSRPFVITLPEADNELRDAIAHALGDQAEIHEPPPDYGIEEIKLFVELWAAGTGAILGTVEVAKLLIKLRDVVRGRAKQKRVRIKVLDGGADVVLTELTDEELHKLAEKSRKESK